MPVFAAVLMTLVPPQVMALIVLLSAVAPEILKVHCAADPTLDAIPVPVSLVKVCDEEVLPFKVIALSLLVMAQEAGGDDDIGPVSVHVEG